MEEILSRLKELTADQLREEILRADLKCGPITATTRAIFERKLARAILGGDGSTSEPDGAPPKANGGNPPRLNPDGAAPTAPTGDSEASSKDSDFGYGMGLNPPEEEALLEKPTIPCSTQEEESGVHVDDQTPSKNTQTSPPVFYGVCPLWDDVLARSERVHVYVDKKEALQAVKMMKGARFKPFSNREDAEKFAKGICDYCPSPSKLIPCISPGKPSLMFHRDSQSTLEAETVNRERANSFKSPRTQDLTAKLRKAVEKGDEAAFTELVWSNPRYLIGSGDNPTVVQEGCRYNVMHVAAKENQPGIAQLLLDTLENPEFMRLMYPDDQETMLQKRIRYIVDLYLNMPDKVGFETPLHFACKFGCPEVVNVLCSHPYTDKTCRNKYDQQPCDVICERKNKTQETKEKISEYLEDRCYVPLLRATDNSSQPVVGVPWSPELLESGPHSLIPRLTGSPKDPVMAVRAFVGPLSPSKAEEFHRVWKTPPRDRAEHFHNILKSDPDRGAERVGRDLAHELGHPWVEYWDFLGGFADLSSADGLRKLEEYLSKKDFSEHAQQETGENETSNRFKTPSPGKPKKFCNSISVGAFLDEGDDISLEEMKNRQNAALTSISAVCARDGLKGAVGGLDFHILPMSCGADLIETAAEQDRLRADKGLLASGKNGLCSPPGSDQTPNGERSVRGASSGLLSPISNLMAEFERMSLQDAALSTPRERRRSGGSRHRDAREHCTVDMASCMARLALLDRDNPAFGQGSMDLKEGGAWRTEERGEVDVDVEDRSSTSSEEYYTVEESAEASHQRTGVLVFGRGVCTRSRSWDHGGRDLCSSGSSGSSYKSLESSERDLILRTPPPVRKGLFIEGESPTRLDREVWSAVEAIEIDPHKYPSIHRWKSTVQAFSSSEMQSWPTPQVAKTRQRLQAYTPGSPGSSLLSTPGRFSPAWHMALPDSTSWSRYSPASANYIQRIRHRHFNEPSF